MMDALLFAGGWQDKQGTCEDAKFVLVDEMQAIGREIAPDWSQYSITKTKWMGSSSRFMTPYEHPVCCHGRFKKPVFIVGKEIDGYEGVFELSYCEDIKPVIGSRLAPTPKDPARRLFKLDGFEEASPKSVTKSSSKKNSKKSSSSGGDK